MTVSVDQQLDALRVRMDAAEREFRAAIEELWRVIGYRSEPTVIMENVEDKERRCAGVTGLLWDGFKRIYRPDTPQPENTTSHE